MKKVKFNTCMSSMDRRYCPGDEVEFSESDAESLINAGYAEAVEEDIIPPIKDGENADPSGDDDSDASNIETTDPSVNEDSITSNEETTDTTVDEIIVASEEKTTVPSDVKSADASASDTKAPAKPKSAPKATASK